MECRRHYSGNPTNSTKCNRPDSSPATIVRPSGLIAQQLIPASADQLATSAPSASSHTLTVWSCDPDTARLPSGVIATALTDAACPCRVRSSAPVSNSHTLSVLSNDPDT